MMCQHEWLYQTRRAHWWSAVHITWYWCTKCGKAKERDL